jgi:hypothetical protein
LAISANVNVGGMAAILHAPTRGEMLTCWSMGFSVNQPCQNAPHAIKNHLVPWKSSPFSASTLPSFPKPRGRGLPNHCGHLVIVDLVGFKKHSQQLETTNSMELASFLMF